MGSREHWEAIYAKRAPEEASWYQSEPEISLRLIEAFAPARSSAIVDVGGGASTLVDSLLRRGYRHLTVCDIAEAALRYARSRIGSASDEVAWRRADILADELPESAFDLWHDRAVFHFLTDAADRKRYVEQAASAVRDRGYVIIATFASDGPDRCSGLEVRRYTAEALAAELGDDFELIQSTAEGHLTPAGVTQHFLYGVFRRVPSANRST